MSIVQSVADTIARVSYKYPAPVGEIVGHLGFTLALRRELLPMLQHGNTAPLVAANIMGLRIIESEHIPPGHYMINGVSYRYTTPTVDEMVAEALRHLADAIAGDVEVHKRAVTRGFKDARVRLGLTVVAPYFLQRQAA